MNTAELIERVRLNCFMTSATHPDYTDAVITAELNDQLNTLFERAIVESRAGYWLKTYDITVTTGVSDYRLPSRACGIEKVELGSGSPTSFVRIGEVPEANARLYERATGTLFAPYSYVLRGDRIVLLPAPDNGGYTIRVYYYIRPSRLVAPQSQGVGGVGGTIRGRVLSVFPSTGNINMNVTPFDQEIATPATLSIGQSIDVVKPDGWHELCLVGGVVSGTGVSAVTIAANFPGLEDVVAGDYVRVSEQTDWPCLPDDFHRCLADSTSVKIMTQLDMVGKASAIAQSVGADLARFQSIISARVKSEPRTIRAPLAALRGRYRSPGRWG